MPVRAARNSLTRRCIHASARGSRDRRDEAKGGERARPIRASLSLEPEEEGEAEEEEGEEESCVAFRTDRKKGEEKNI